jgi:hypothetical protein
MTHREEAERLLASVHPSTAGAILFAAITHALLALDAPEEERVDEFTAGTYLAKGILDGRKEAAEELKMLLSERYAGDRFTPEQRLEVVEAWIKGKDNA